MWLNCGTLLSSYTRTVGKTLTEPSLQMEINREWGGGGQPAGQCECWHIWLHQPTCFPSLHTNSNEGEVLRGGHRDLWIHF